MPFIFDAPMVLPPPDDWDDSGLVGGTQAECVFGVFGEIGACRASMVFPGTIQASLPAKRLDALCSGGMTFCSAVFLRFITADVRLVGAVIHFDNQGDPGAMFSSVMGLYHMNTPHHRLQAEVYLVTDLVYDQTGMSAYNHLWTAGFQNIVQYRTPRGSAAMDAMGNVFDHYAL